MVCCVTQRYRLIRGHHARKRDSGIHKAWIECTLNPRGWNVIPHDVPKDDKFLFRRLVNPFAGTKFGFADCADSVG
jgi:hypothetical protein